MIIDFLANFFIGMLDGISRALPSCYLPQEWINVIVSIRETLDRWDEATPFPLTEFYIALTIVMGIELVVYIIRLIKGIANWLRGAGPLE